ncbi:phosphatase-like protein [Trypanosoma rangeli]|uniref:Phosphatase-like protein n=1 Tax=Trypanosoma rangeli TaxID=5698 RepID=A0A3R7M4C8_TRYRA|eukprot:RNF08805.1 phosphatase-like protein [Trypanosoma rangeli]
MSVTTKPFEGTVRCEWFQSPARVSFCFYVRDRQEGDVRVEAGAQSLSVTIRLDASGREYQYTVDRLYASLAGEIPVVNVRTTKVEVSLKKASELQWPTLEAPDGGPSAPPQLATSAPIATVNPPASAGELKYPNSRGKDWNAWKIDDEDVKPEGDQALNALFQQIYSNGTDEQRRAMMKSFLESNGTVLSTNWEDVGNREVKAEPPTGMEAKPYN